MDTWCWEEPIRQSLKYLRGKDGRLRELHIGRMERILDFVRKFKSKELYDQYAKEFESVRYIRPD